MSYLICRQCGDEYEPRREKSVWCDQCIYEAGERISKQNEMGGE